MRIEEDVKLDFSDVLMRPKRSNLSSRKDVSLERELVFKYGGKNITCVPIMNSNMGTCGTFGVARSLADYNCLYTVHKFHDMSTWMKELRPMGNRALPFLNNMFFPIGIDEDSFSLLKDVKRFVREELSGAVPNIMIDVANGYSEKFVDRIKFIREQFPDSVIVAGNVATPDMTEALILAGADIVKIGVGSGSVCIHEDEVVHTKRGMVSIKDITMEDTVLTHNGKYEKVLNKFKKNTDTLIEINGVKCTPDHKFLVAHADDVYHITEQNYMQYAFWCTAEKLDLGKHFLIEL